LSRRREPLAIERTPTQRSAIHGRRVRAHAAMLRSFHVTPIFSSPACLLSTRSGSRRPARLTARESEENCGELIARFVRAMRRGHGAIMRDPPSRTTNSLHAARNRARRARHFVAIAATRLYVARDVVLLARDVQSPLASVHRRFAGSLRFALLL